MHPVDSNEISFKLAARNAFKEAFRNAGPKIMEPICNIEIMVPGEYMGDVMSDLQGRRAMIEGMSSVKGFEVLKARVPLAELYKYSTTLSSLTSGRANPARQNGRTSSLLSTQTGCLQTRPSGTRPHRLIPVRLFVLEQVVPVPLHILDGRETGQGPYTVIRDAVPYHKLPGKHKPGGHYFFSF